MDGIELLEAGRGHGPAMTAPAGPAEDEDRHFVLHDISWAQYEAILAMFEGRSAPRLTYCKGTLELMSPSRRHEHIKKLFARLIELYALERNIELYAYGSTTFRKEAAERGLEPDECYAVGRDLEDDPLDVPDLAFEVVLTSGWIDKLDVYRGLGVPEVWFWHHGRLHVHRLGPVGYSERATSELLPDLDLAVLSRFLEMPSQSEAVRAWRDVLRAPR